MWDVTRVGQAGFCPGSSNRETFIVLYWVVAKVFKFLTPYKII